MTITAAGIQKLSVLFELNGFDEFEQMKIFELISNIKINCENNFKLSEILNSNDLYNNDNNNSNNYLINSNSNTSIRNFDEKSNIDQIFYFYNNFENSIYIGQPVHHVVISGCTDCEIVLMAVTGTVLVQYCERVTVRCVSNSVRIENCFDSKFFLFCLSPPLIAGDSRGLVLAPFNVLYTHHDQVLSRTSIHPDAVHANVWRNPINVSIADPCFSILAPDKWRLINFCESEKAEVLGVCVPEEYEEGWKKRDKEVSEMKNNFANNSDKYEKIFSGYFREFLQNSNKIRILSDLAKLKII
jgi:hypothetical protein